MNKETIKDLGVNVCRFVVALTFVFSGYVKAVDPIGTQYKLNDYLAAVNLEGTVPDYLTLSASVLLAAVELSLGILLLFAIPGALAGTRLLQTLDAATVRRLFGGMLILTGGSALWRELRTARRARQGKEGHGLNL